AATPAATSEGAAEDRLENVAGVAEIGLLAAARVLRKGRVAVAVIGGALLGVLQALVGGADRLELVLVVLAPAVAVGMALHRQLAISGLDRRAVRGARDAEQFVEIMFHRGHSSDPARTLTATGAPGDGG